MKKFTLPKDGGLLEEGLPNGVKHTYERIPAHIYEDEELACERLGEKTEDLDIDVSGASSLKGLQVNGKSMDVDCSGASKLSVSGNFSKEVGIEVSGAGVMTYNGDSDALEADLNGASSLKCEGKYSTTDIRCSGASKAELKGKGNHAEYDCSGASAINAEEFSVMKAEVELTGASSLKISVSDVLNYNVSTSSKMTYYGDPTLYNKSSSANVVKGR